MFRVAVERAGLPAGTTSHDLRHHYATGLLSAGLSVVEVAELLGHEDTTQVVQTYGHSQEGFEVRARKVIESAWNTVQERPADSVTAQGPPR